MSSPAKQPAKKGGGGGGGGGWGSLFSNTITNLESRLDTILAEDSDASARERAGDEARRKAASALQRSDSGRLAPAAANKDGSSREASRTRGTGRLAERLARATAVKTPSQAGSAVPSRVGTPAIADESRASGESKRSAELARGVPEIAKPDEQRGDGVAVKGTAEGGEGEDSTLLQSGLPINPARVSMDSSRPSAEIVTADASSRPSLDVPNGHVAQSDAELEADVSRLREEYAAAEKQRQDEMHTYMEKIDALQAKLQYLAQETVAAAKEANSSASAGKEEKELATKDERIALLMQEGEKLSKTELKHLQTIKKLRAAKAEDDKLATELKRRLEKVERSESDLKARLRKADVAERQANEKTRQIAAIEKQVDELRIDRENAAELVRSLNAQLKEAKQKADKAETDAASKASEIDKGKIAALENELEDAKIEKKLAADRATADGKKMREETEAEKQRAAVRELELKNEIASLESRLEAMRARVEEGFSSAEGGESGGGAGHVKLLRQVETLQSQYSLAKENWEAIEASLNSRLAALEKERDEAVRREGELRRKARDAQQRVRALEEELEVEREGVAKLESEARGHASEVAELRKTLAELEAAVEEAKGEPERQRRLWEVEMQQRLDEERAKWQRQHGKPGRNDSPPAFAASRKVSSSADLHPNGGHRPRSAARDLSSLHTDAAPTSSFSRRSSHHLGTPRSALRSAAPHRQDSFPSLETPTAAAAATPTVSIASVTPFSDADNDNDGAASSPSPTAASRTLNDLLSTSGAPDTSAAGPSVQLVERLSATIRRLESEKAGFRDEVARLSAQRDAARGEVVALMREREEGERKEVEAVRERYEAALEMLGEREEECVELRADVGELKRLYRELVDEKTAGR